MRRRWRVRVAIWLCCVWGTMMSCDGTHGECPAACANLDSPILYPWGTSSACAAAPGFVLSGCSSNSSSPPVLWSLPGDPLQYAVQGISYYGSSGLLNLTSLSHDTNATRRLATLCAHPSNTSSIGTYMTPPLIASLSSFPYFDLISPSMVYLLFGCDTSRLPLLSAQLRHRLRAKSLACSSYSGICHTVAAAQCVEFSPYAIAAEPYVCRNYDFSPYDMSSFKSVGGPLIDMMGCSGFKSAEVDVYDDTHTWDPALLQLTWNFGPDDPGNCDKVVLCGTTTAVIVYGVVPAAILLLLCAAARLLRTSATFLGARVRTTATFLGAAFRHVAVDLSRALLLISATRGSMAHRKLLAEMDSLPIKQFSYSEILQATNSFSEDKMIGAGGCGSVYKASLKDGRQVAVKRLKHNTFKRIDQFLNEVKIVASLKHRNLIQLYGFCCHETSALHIGSIADDLLLVFEYAPRGSLAGLLHNTTSAEEENGLPWKLRLTIALEIADALSYLHNSVSPPIFHRDIKTGNILLDDSLHAKLADFGLSKLKLLEAATHISTLPQGTPGYIDPDYFLHFQLTEKSDVYSFGVVLLELVSGKLPVDVRRDPCEVSLAHMALAKTTMGMWEDLIDHRLIINGEDTNVEKMVKEVVALALACINANKHERPDMAYVLQALVTIKESGYQLDSTNYTLQELDHQLDIQASSYYPPSDLNSLSYDGNSQIISPR